MLQVNDTDIERVERLLLPEGKAFNAERRAFIRCMESRDVVACPGSGKTTALLAKLLILANKLPFEDGRGVCVLTHTNVAIGEIKNKAGSVAGSLFRYPNFFGTIQQFVDKFLAIPAYVSRFGVREVVIDSDQYYKKIEKLYYEIGLQKNGAIFAQLREQLKGLSWDEQNHIKISFLADLKFKFENEYVHYLRADTGKIVVSGSGTSKSYPDIHAVKYGALKEGYLRYQDAFSLALWYIKEHSQVSETFGCRFAYVFVDEAQDTDADQNEVLNILFSDLTRSVVQFLGDPNQAIFQSQVRQGLNWQPAGNPPLLFSDSLRYGKSIADLLGTVRIDSSISLLPNPERDSFSPHMLLFEEGDEQSVIPAFASLILNLELSDSSGGKFKAVGWVGKDKRNENKLCIPSYFCPFEKNPAKKRNRFSNLLSYICAVYSDCDSRCSEGLYNSIMRGVVHAVTLANCKNSNDNRAFTASSYTRFLKENNEKAYNSLKQILSYCVLQRQREKITSKQVRDYIAEALRKLYSSVNNHEWNTFLCNDLVDITENSEQKSSNTFIYNDDIHIDVATVHSVKGETHVATLYLATSYYGATEASRLLPFIKGEYPKTERSKARHIESLKMAHVAFSRPTHLLAFACSAPTIEGHEGALKQNGWIIKRVSELIDVQGDGE